MILLPNIKGCPSLFCKPKISGKQQVEDVKRKDGVYTPNVLPEMLQTYLPTDDIWRSNGKAKEE